MNMIDQCKHCTLHGDIEGCKAIECSQHESWYARQMISENAQLKARVAELEECNANLQSLISAAMLSERQTEILTLKKVLVGMYDTGKKIVDTNKFEGAKLMIRSLERRITKLERGEL